MPPPPPVPHSRLHLFPHTTSVPFHLLPREDAADARSRHRGRKRRLRQAAFAAPFLARCIHDDDFSIHTFGSASTNTSTEEGG